MEICDMFLCKNRKDKQCVAPRDIVAFVCKHTEAPCPKAICEYCERKKLRNKIKNLKSQ